MDSDQNVCCQSNLKRKADTGRTCQLLQLLHGTPYFEVMLNRRMPNGMYGGVSRGEKFSPTRFFAAGGKAALDSVIGSYHPDGGLQPTGFAYLFYSDRAKDGEM